MSRATMIIFLIAIPLLIYGYLCRLLNISFFWDSKHFGWIMAGAGFLSFLIDQRKARLAQNRNIFFIRIGVAILIIIFAAFVSTNIVIRTSPDHAIIIENIKKSGEIKNEVGEIRGFGLFISGFSLNTMKNSLSYGPIEYTITVRGSTGHKDLEINPR
jgi:asparagine N-glycosylation enzyme membrane subunit Stt3